MGTLQVNFTVSGLTEIQAGQIKAFLLAANLPPGLQLSNLVVNYNSQI